MVEEQERWIQSMVEMNESFFSEHTRQSRASIFFFTNRSDYPEV
jgi:hypothetical protein